MSRTLVASFLLLNVVLIALRRDLSNREDEISSYLVGDLHWLAAVAFGAVERRRGVGGSRRLGVRRAVPGRAVHKPVRLRLRRPARRSDLAGLGRPFRERDYRLRRDSGGGSRFLSNLAHMVVRCAGRLIRLVAFPAFRPGRAGHGLCRADVAALAVPEPRRSRWPPPRETTPLSFVPSVDNACG